MQKDRPVLFPRNQQRYSQLAKKLQIAAIIIGAVIMIAGTIKAYGHMELHMHQDAGMMYDELKNEMAQAEREILKVIERTMYPDRSEQERKELETEIDKGTYDNRV